MNSFSTYTHRTKFSLFIVAFGFIGGLIIVASHAASSSNLIDPEGSILSGNVSNVADSTASGGLYIKFQACPENQTGTPPNCVASGLALTVNASTVVNNFDTKMKGIGLANWNFTKTGWGKPYVGQVQGLPQALTAIDPGIIRYAGGLWSNYVGFDRTKQQVTPHNDWVQNGNTYSFSYGTDELASLDTFAKSLNSDVMIQVNVSQNDPAMWADLVRYAQEKRLYEL